MEKSKKKKKGNGAERQRNPLSDRTNSSTSSSSAFKKSVTKCGNSRVSNINFGQTRDKSNGVKDLDLPKPCRKKQRLGSYEQDVSSKDAKLQDFIEKQKAYFKEIDEFKLMEEEVDFIDEL